MHFPFFSRLVELTRTQWRLGRWAKRETKVKKNFLERNAKSNQSRKKDGGETESKAILYRRPREKLSPKKKNHKWDRIKSSE